MGVGIADQLEAGHLVAVNHRAWPCVQWHDGDLRVPPVPADRHARRAEPIDPYAELSGFVHLNEPIERDPAQHFGVRVMEPTRAASQMPSSGSRQRLQTVWPRPSSNFTVSRSNRPPCRAN